MAPSKRKQLRKSNAVVEDEEGGGDKEGEDCVALQPDSNTVEDISKGWQTPEIVVDSLNGSCFVFRHRIHTLLEAVQHGIGSSPSGT